MQEIPPPLQQMNLVNLELSKPPSNDFVCMIAADWWNKWNESIEARLSDALVLPGPINNTDLM